MTLRNKYHSKPMLYPQSLCVNFYQITFTTEHIVVVSIKGILFVGYHHEIRVSFCDCKSAIVDLQAWMSLISCKVSRYNACSMLSFVSLNKCLFVVIIGS